MFEISEKVVCVNDLFPPEVHILYTSLPEKGKVYVIRDILPGHNYNGGTLADSVAVLLVGVNNPISNHGVEGGFATHRFRRLEDVKSESSLSKEKLIPF